MAAFPLAVWARVLNFAPTSPNVIEFSIAPLGVIGPLPKALSGVEDHCQLVGELQRIDGADLRINNEF